MPQELGWLPAGAEQSQVQRKSCSFVGSAGCSQNWPTCTTKIPGMPSVCAFPKPGLNQLHLETGRMLPLLRAGGCVCAAPAPSGTQHGDIWTAVVPFLRDMCHGFLTWGSGSCEPVTKEASRVGPKCPKCSKWEKSQISSYRSPNCCFTNVQKAKFGLPLELLLAPGKCFVWSQGVPF